MAVLHSISTLFGLPGSLFNWSCLPGQQRRNLFRVLAQASTAFHDAYETDPQQKMSCKYVLRWFETYNTQLDTDICMSLAGMSDHVHVFDVERIRVGVADLMRELLGSIVDRYLRALREVPIILIDAIDQMDEIGQKCIVEMLDAIKAYIVVKTDREFLGAQNLPNNFPDRVINAIANPLEDCVVNAYSDFLYDLGHGNGKFSEHAGEHTAACMNTLFLDIGLAFSYQSNLIHWIDEPEEDEEEPVPEHVANHQFDQYHDDDWFRGQLQIVDTQTDVLPGPQNVTVDEVSIPTALENETFCGLCGNPSYQIRELKACGHAMCANCLGSQVRAEHPCRYKCAYCRAEFFPEPA